MTKNEFEEYRDNIAFFNIPSKITSDTILLQDIGKGSVRESDESTARFYLIGSDGDVLLGTFVIIEDPLFPSWLVLERINNKVLKGSFQGVFVNTVTDLNANLRYPDTISLTNGQFLARQID